MSRGRAPAGVFLAVVFLGAALAFPFRAADWLSRVERIGSVPTSLEGEAGPAPSAFSFDPDYAGFLEALRSATPDDAQIALETPPGELYVYQAAYRLAPRRILSKGTPAPFLARFRQTAFPRGAVSISPHGTLERRP